MVLCQVVFQNARNAARLLAFNKIGNNDCVRHFSITLAKFSGNTRHFDKNFKIKPLTFLVFNYQITFGYLVI